jgi:hypothetical protein
MLQFIFLRPISVIAFAIPKGNSRTGDADLYDHTEVDICLSPTSVKVFKIVSGIDENIFYDSFG